MKVLVTVPNEHWIHAEVAAVLLRLQRDPCGYDLRIEMPSARPYENNLHGIISQMLLPSECIYWLNIDADNPPKRNPLELVALDKDVIGLPTPVWHYQAPGDFPVYLNAYQYDPASGAYRMWPTPHGLQRVDAIGSGCFLAHRRVFEHPLNQGGCFARTTRDDGTVEFGADLAFCQRAMLAGFELYCHFDYQCRHFAEIDLDRAAQASFGLVTHGR